MRRPLRRDAQERRDKLLAAAQREFAAHGVDASLEKIARDAGVAIGTLYRHFPARLDLLMAAFQPRLQEFLDGANKALEMNDPWEGLVYYLEHLFGMQAGDRGFNDFLSRRFTDSAETERIHDEMCQQIVDILTRAQDAGRARRDITLADIVSAVEGPQIILAEHPDHCEGHCILQEVWVGVDDESRRILERVTLAELVARTRVGHPDAVPDSAR